MDKIDLSQVAVGDIVFFMNDTWLSKAIRLVETGFFSTIAPSHVAIVETVLDDDLGLIEALYSVKRNKMSAHMGSYVWIARIKDPKDIAKGLAFVQSKVGDGYDYLALAGIACRCFWRLMGTWVYEHSLRVRNFLASKQKFFCSELGYDCCQQATGLEPCHENSEECTPYDLFRSTLLNVYQQGRYT